MDSISSPGKLLELYQESTWSPSGVHQESIWRIPGVYQDSLMVHNGCYLKIGPDGLQEDSYGLLMDSKWTPDTVPGVYLDS